MSLMQSALRLIYPDQCVACGAMVNGSLGFCGACWRDTPFIMGPVCRTCNHPLLDDGDDTNATQSCEAKVCDDCLTLSRDWSEGRAALVYTGRAKRIILGLKHADRTELARPAARWMANAGRDILADGALLVPIPVHWKRLFRRRYNQAAVLAGELSSISGLSVMPDALIRPKATRLQDGMSVEERFANLENAIVAKADLTGRHVVLIDDVMTSGATLNAAAKACLGAGACRVDALVLARAVKTP